MPAEVDLDERREPAQVVLAVPAGGPRPGGEKGGLREVELRGYGLHPCGVAEAVSARRGAEDDGGGVARVGAVGERVDDEGLHPRSLPRDGLDSVSGIHLSHMSEETT